MYIRLDENTDVLILINTLETRIAELEQQVEELEKLATTFENKLETARIIEFNLREKLEKSHSDCADLSKLRDEYACELTTAQQRIAELEQQADKDEKRYLFAEQQWKAYEQLWNQAQQREAQLVEALNIAVSKLSLIKHRGKVNWGETGMPHISDVSGAIHLAEKALPINLPNKYALALEVARLFVNYSNMNGIELAGKVLAFANADQAACREGAE